MNKKIVSGFVLVAVLAAICAIPAVAESIAPAEKQVKLSTFRSR